MDTTRATLLLRVRDRGDARAWGEFDAIYRPMLYRFARARGLDRPDAEEVVQESMAAIASHIGRFEYDPEKGRFKGWLRTIVLNNVRRLCGRRRPQQARTADLNAAAARETPPDELFDRLWLDEHLRYGLEQVRQDVEDATFQAFQLYVIEDRPASEVCARFGLSANRLYQIKWRLMRKLNERMSALVGEAG